MSFEELSVPPRDFYELLNLARIFATHPGEGGE